MKTINRLIQDGLKCGTLIKAFDSIFQYADNGSFFVIATNDKYLQEKKHSLDVAYIEYLCHSTFLGEITTAFDSDIDIDPITLPFPEPIDATGWIVTDGWKFEPLSFTDKYAEDGHHQLYDWKDCKPCLPPAK